MVRPTSWEEVAICGNTRSDSNKGQRSAVRAKLLLDWNAFLASMFQSLSDLAHLFLSKYARVALTAFSYCLFCSGRQFRSTPNPSASRVPDTTDRCEHFRAADRSPAQTVPLRGVDMKCADTREPGLSGQAAPASPQLGTRALDLC